MSIRSAKLFAMAGLLMGLLAGCASTVPFQKANIDEGKALIYVFRPESVFARGELFKLEVNGEMKGLLVNNAYLPVPVNPGEVTVTVLSNKLISKQLASLSLNTQAGSAYYVKAEPGLAWKVMMVQLDEAQGAEEVASTSFYQTR